MIAIRVGGIEVTSLDDDAFGVVLEAAAAHGGSGAFPALYALADPETVAEPAALMDELAELARTDAGRAVAVQIGTLRDDLMTAVAAAGEG
jgi:hypothetical protein